MRQSAQFIGNRRAKVMLIIIMMFVIGSCTHKEPVITVVDIGDNNRIMLGKVLRIIREQSPKLIALDFFLDNDSLALDSILVKELDKAQTRSW